MLKHRKLFLVFITAIILGLGFFNSIHLTNALSWDSWTSSAVGDISETSLTTYWTIASTPKPGYENNLWPNWQTVIDSNLDSYANGDKEIHFTTYSNPSYMGKIELSSKAKIKDTNEVTFRGRFGCKWSYNQVRTLGQVQLFDVTTQTVTWSQDIQSGPTKDVWTWNTFSSGLLSLVYTHEYVIKLKGNDAWIQQKVAVAWESAEVWFHTPYYRTLSHGPHTWRHEYHWPFWWHIYECRFRSDFYFKSTPIADMVRDHRPYVTGIGQPYGWDPCYLHEFRSVPYATLEGDEWYSTDLPGSIGYTDSTDYEEQQDGYEEIEVYTRNPESLVSGHLYYVSLRYQVWQTGSVTVTLESELGNEADNLAPLSPPAFPVAYIDIKETTVSHSQCSYISLFYSKITGESNSSEYTKLQDIYYIEQHPTFDVIIVGKIPAYVKIFLRLKINDEASLNEFLETKEAAMRSSTDQINQKSIVPVTITFNGIVNTEEVLELLNQYNLQLFRFRFTASGDGKIIRGQGTPLGTEPIPLDELNDFIDDYHLLGIQSIDAYVDSRNLELLAEHPLSTVVDFAAYIAALNANIDLGQISEIRWYIEDASWYISKY